MKKMILLLLSFSFIFTGCTSKPQIVFKPKYLCTEQQTLHRQEPVGIRIHKEDKNVALAYKSSIDSSFEFYENQVSRNNKFCKEIVNGKN